MIDVIIIGLTALSAVTGFSSSGTYPEQYDEYMNMADAIDQTVTSVNGNFQISNTLYCNDLYTVTGENRYYELAWDNGYLIYDKKHDEIDEIFYGKVSPYYEYQGDFKIYNEEVFDFKYVVFNSKSNCFVDILNNDVVNEEITSYYEINQLDDAGTYYVNIYPGIDAHLAKNSFYFKNLYHRHGYNKVGTCSVVSSEILLGYYDTFINDQIVSEKYDCITREYIPSNNIRDFSQSPGVDDYDQDIHSFHDLLVGIGKDIGDDPEVNGMTTSNQIKMIKKYLNNNSINNYSINVSPSTNSDFKKNKAIKLIKEAIDAGRPVISNGSGHSTVAYAYDDNYVYVHTGWGSIAATPWVTFDSTQNDNRSAGCIDLIFEGNLEHCHSNNYFSTATNNFICPCGALFEEVVLKPCDYGFASQYYFAEKSRIIHKDNLVINTKRLRTGYVENEYINLSPKRENAGEAYLEYTFNKSIERLSFSISFWSNIEDLYPSDGDAYFEVMDSFGNWRKYIDLLNDISLSKNRKKQDRLEFVFKSKNVYSIRFIAHSKPVGDRNKGRISIGDLIILHYS